ncbi:hypothetical protein Tco_1376308 [Tanacetum coccineum]
MECTVVASRGWSFASAVLGPMTHLIASTTLASANSGVMQGASCTQRKISMDKASSVRVQVANVTLFSSAQLLRENTDSVRISLGLVFLLGLSTFAMAAACASRTAAIPLVISYRMAASVMVGVADVDVLLGGIYMQDNTE